MSSRNPFIELPKMGEHKGFMLGHRVDIGEGKKGKVVGFSKDQTGKVVLDVEVKKIVHYSPETFLNKNKPS